MKFVWAVKDDFSLRKRKLFVVTAYLHPTRVNINHFPEVVTLAVEDEILVKFIVMNSYDFRNVDERLQCGFYIGGFHIYASSQNSRAQK